MFWVCERNEDNRRRLPTIIIIERSVTIHNIYIDIMHTINRVTIAQITIRPNTVRPYGLKGKRYDIQETHPTNTNHCIAIESLDSFILTPSTHDNHFMQLAANQFCASVLHWFIIALSFHAWIFYHFLSQDLYVISRSKWIRTHRRTSRPKRIVSITMMESQTIDRSDRVPVAWSCAKRIINMWHRRQRSIAKVTPN